MIDFQRGISARRFIKALLQDGFIHVRSKGSHRIFRHPDGRRVNVTAHHSNDTFPIGTLKSMIVDAGWNIDDRKRLGLPI